MQNPAVVHTSVTSVPFFSHFTVNFKVVPLLCKAFEEIEKKPIIDLTYAQPIPP